MSCWVGPGDIESKINPSLEAVPEVLVQGPDADDIDAFQGLDVLSGAAHLDQAILAGLSQDSS